MTNELKTRRLIVTLPNVSGEEADEIAAHLEGHVVENMNEGIIDATVTHALGETVPDLTLVERYQGLDRVNLQLWRSLFTPAEARQLAGALLALADDIEGV